MCQAEIDQIWNGGSGASIEDLINSADTDGDGLLDIHETNTGTYVSATDTGSDPNDPDSDNDTVNDGDEVVNGSDPNTPDDTDLDGILNADETSGAQNPWTGSTLGTPPGDATLPLGADSDGDGIDDGEEVVAGADGTPTARFFSAARKSSALWKRASRSRVSAV